MYKNHLQRLKERHSNAVDFLEQIFPLQGAELAFVNLEVSSGTPTWNGTGNLDFTIGVKDGESVLNVLHEFTTKARQSNLRVDLSRMEVKHNLVRKDESHTSQLRNGVFVAEVHCVLYVHYNTPDCTTVARDKVRSGMAG